MPNPPIPVAGEAMPGEGQTFNTTEERARAFIAALRGAGHSPNIEPSGVLGILLGTHAQTVPEPVCHLGADRCYPLGFDDRPFPYGNADFRAAVIALLEADDDQ